MLQYATIYNGIQCTMKTNMIQYDTIYNEIQYTIPAIYYNEQWNTIYNENNMIQSYYNGQYDTMDNIVWYQTILQ